jgi:hypothetical protein
MMRKAVLNPALFVFVLSLSASALQGPPEKREPGFRWFADLDAAIHEARDRNVPLLVALHKDK